MADDAELKALAARLVKAATEITVAVTEITAVADRLTEMAEAPEPPEPEPPPELILSRSNVTAVETLPVGALLGCRLITAAVTFNGPPGTRPEKLVGADSTANAKGGMCMERRSTGKYSVWVQADGTQMVQLALDSDGPMFLTFELPDNGFALTAEASKDTDFTAMPRAPDPFDGAAALLAGYWNGKQVDPAKATIHELRAYRGWSLAQIDRDRAAWATLFPSA